MYNKIYYYSQVFGASIIRFIKMPKTSEISFENRVRAIVLYEEGHSLRYISKSTGISYGGVHYVINKFKGAAKIENSFRSGRPKKTSEAEDRQIIITSKRNRFKTAPIIASEGNELRLNAISDSTVKRRLSEVGLNGRVAKKKPFLNKKNMKKRLEFAKSHLHWTEDDWAQVLWTDESKFEIFGNKRRLYVRRFEHEKASQQCIAPTVKHGGGSVMVWGCFSRAGVGDLIEVQGKMKADQYQNIILKHAEPSGFRLIGAGFELQQDNDPKHKAKSTMLLLEKKQRQGMFTLMDWPSQSPDFNPIELLWDELDRKVRADPPSSRTDLIKKLQNYWREITPKCIKKLLDRMPKICREVINQRGGYIDENKF